MSQAHPWMVQILTYTPMPSVALYQTPSMLLVLDQAGELRNRGGEVRLGLAPNATVQ